MERFVADRPDAALVAVDFPRLKGLHVGELIRRTEQGGRIPMLAIDKGHLGKAKGVAAVLRLKPDAYIGDPLKPNELVSKLDALLVGGRLEASSAVGIHVTLGRPPVAAGDLKGRPLPSLMHSLFRLERYGVLLVVSGDLVRRVFYVAGRPVAYDSTARQDSFPALLVDRREISEEMAEKVLSFAGLGDTMGVALKKSQVPLQGEGLLQKLREYTGGKIAQMIGMRSGRYAFYAGAEFAEEIRTVDIPALAPILDGARRSYPVQIFARSLRPFLSHFPKRAPRFAADLSSLGLSPNDLKIAMEMDGRILLADLLVRGDLRRSVSLLWFLTLTEEVVYPPVADSSAAAPPGANPGAVNKRRPMPKEMLQKLRQESVKIIAGSYLQVLGLDIAADTQDVERAYKERTAQFHPDVFSEYDTSEISDLLQSVNEKLLASYRVLSVEEKRKGYLQYLLSRLDVGRTAGVNLDAEIALRRGEAALRRKDPQTALRAFEEAVSRNPREPEYYCHLAWATYLAVPGRPRERSRSALPLLRKALALNPYLERAAIISAIIEGEAGDVAGARKRLLKVLEQNPDSKLAKAALRKVGR